MGSYAECWLSKFYIGSTKNHADPSLMMQLFSSSDKKIIKSNKSNLPNPLSWWAEYIEEDEYVDIIFYSAVAKVIKDRLDLIGYSMNTCKKAYNCYLENEIKRYEEYISGYDGEVFKETLDILKSMNLKIWFSSLKKIYDNELEHKQYPQENNELEHKQYSQENDDYSIISYMLKEELYGFPGGDINVALRLMLEILPEDDELIYDVTHLIRGGYYDFDEDIIENVINTNSQYYYDTGKRIILTEGKFDTFVLSESLNLLYPHLANYFTFMDFDGAKVGGGAGSLANMVKSFSGAGVINKVVAVFDNDTAAHAALKGLQKVKIAKNIKIFTLPEIEFLSNYPTIGPSGMVLLNINSLVGSIEMYLGKEVLSDEEGNYYPIQWTGFESGLRKYQGEITEKSLVQKKFEEKLEYCKKDKNMMTNFDWSEIKTILEGIFRIFHEDDEKQIVSWAEKYCS
jgi:hypothetical protein